MKKPKKLKPMSPHEARTDAEMGALETDNYNTAEGWILLMDHGKVVLYQQRTGEASTGRVEFTRAAFKRMIDWYLRPQDRSGDSATGDV
jgi:hypothetical protein